MHWNHCRFKLVLLYQKRCMDHSLLQNTQRMNATEIMTKKKAFENFLSFVVSVKFNWHRIIGCVLHMWSPAINQTTLKYVAGYCSHLNRISVSAVCVFCAQAFVPQWKNWKVTLTGCRLRMHCNLIFPLLDYVNWSLKKQFFFSQKYITPWQGFVNQSCRSHGCGVLSFICPDCLSVYFCSSVDANLC